MRKKTIFLGNLLLIMGLSLGYAFLTTTLNIEGIADIDSNTWDVYWDNVQVKEGSVTADTPTIDANETAISFSVHLSQPGDFYEFTVDAVNDGSIDAMIETITKTINGGTTIPSYLNYTVTYADDIEIENNHLLAADTFETYKVRIEYRTDINVSDLPETQQSLSIDFEINYIQADQNANRVRQIVYFGSEVMDPAEVILGNPINVNAHHSTLEEAQTSTEGMGPSEIYHLKGIVVNGILKEVYLEFVITDEMTQDYTGLTPGTYSLRGGGATLNSDTNRFNSDSIYFEDNKTVLLNAFSSNCLSSDYGIECSVGNHTIIATNDGECIWEYHPVEGTAYGCGINEWDSNPGIYIIGWYDLF